MLDLSRYLLGVAELCLLVGFASLGAMALRRRLLPELDAAPAHLATTVLAIAILLWAAELLGSFGLFEPFPYLAAVAVLGSISWVWAEGGRGHPSGAAASRFSPSSRPRTAALSSGEKPSKTEGCPRPPSWATVIALTIAVIATIHFAAGVKTRLSTGITGFDSTWYHGPFAAGFFQSGDTWGLHFIAPQFLAWFYPANSEVLHAVGMVAFGRDILSPLLNLGWFMGCLVAAWCIGRPYRVAPWSLALAALALSVPTLHDQAGEARNDIVGIFFLLAAVAVALNAWSARDEGQRGLGTGSLLVIGLAAGLGAGTKLNLLLPAGVLIVGLIVIAPRGDRGRALEVSGLAALAGGGYWYLRNLAHTGNPLPWVKHLGPFTLPAPDQALGGRESHSVFSYLTDGSVWSDWFLPGLHHGLTFLWPLALALALVGLLLCLGGRSDPILRVSALVGLAAAFAWLIAPTSASGPDGMPHGFESGLRYLAPSLVLGFALLSVALRERLGGAGAGSPSNGRILKAPSQLARRLSGRGATRPGLIVAVVFIAVALGYPVQRHYLQHRYKDPSFATPGLNAAFKWAQGTSDSRIATTSTRQYPLFGRNLSNEVDYIGEKQPHGGFTAPTTCRQWRRLLNEGDYGYVVTTRDRLEPGKPPYPPTSDWTAGAGAESVLRKPPTVVYKLKGRLDPSTCRQ